MVSGQDVKYTYVTASDSLAADIKVAKTWSEVEGANFKPGQAHAASPNASAGACCPPFAGEVVWVWMSDCSCTVWLIVHSWTWDATLTLATLVWTVCKIQAQIIWLNAFSYRLVIKHGHWKILYKNHLQINMDIQNYAVFLGSCNWEPGWGAPGCRGGLRPY